MNNSKLAFDSIKISSDEFVDIEPQLQEREAKLTRIITALQGITRSAEWSTLKTELFDGMSASLERSILIEAKQNNPDVSKLNRLTGQLKYADLNKIEETFRQELAHIKNKLHAPNA